MAVPSSTGSSTVSLAGRGEEAVAPALSVVIPVHDEQDNVEALYHTLKPALDGLGRSYEVIVVDDGSSDETYSRLGRLAASDERLKLVRLRRNYGQTAARKDGFVRRLPSRAANWLIGRVTGVRLHDYGCTLKAYRAEIVHETRLYGEMHRFLPALAHQAGARIAEIPVRHHPRVAGRSKYGLGRTIKVLLDLLTVKVLSVWSTKPSYVFGGSGFVLCLLGSLFVAWTAYQRLFNGVFVYRQPALLVGVFLFTIGLNLILLALLAELIVRTHHESQSKPVYLVRERRNFGLRAASVAARDSHVRDLRDRRARPGRPGGAHADHSCPGPCPGAGTPAVAV